eukprot:TRINITY_DN5950_c0_g1_i2.p1 TRINITY_DN5950_c0_g1~~TRINITY_DN5950_c0_g1_i2.p1  ORF type:complete len:693 (-),score=128.83 TRINITY_DN5950_c0_g1_i2:389-2467(-)
MIADMPSVQNLSEEQKEIEGRALIDHIFRHGDNVAAVLAVSKKATCGVRQQRLETARAKRSKTTSRFGAERKSDSTTNSFVLLAGADGVANIWDPCTGQCVHSVRAPTMREMYTPLLYDTIIVLQLSAFNFAESYKWHEAVSPMRTLSGLFTLDAGSLVSISNAIFAFKMPYEAAYLAFTAFSQLGILIYIVVVVGDLIGVEERWLLAIEVSQSFREEVKAGLTGFTKRPMGPQHVRFQRGMWRMAFWRALISLFATVLVVPCCKRLLWLMNCEEASEGGLRSIWPSLVCYEGWHLALVGISAVLLPLFCFLVIPYSVVKGQSEVVAWEDLLEPSQWYRNCEQVCDMVDMGPMQVSAHTYFWFKLLEVLARIAVPGIAMLTERRPYLQGSLMTLLHLLIVLQALRRRIYVTGSTSALSLGSKTIGLLAASSALLSAVLSDEQGQQSWVPVALWYGGLLAIMITVVVVYSRRRTQEDNAEAKLRQKQLTSSEEEAICDRGLPLSSLISEPQPIVEEETCEHRGSFDGVAPVAPRSCAAKKDNMARTASASSGPSIALLPVISVSPAMCYREPPEERCESDGSISSPHLQPSANEADILSSADTDAKVASQDSLPRLYGGEAAYPGPGAVSPETRSEEPVWASSRSKGSCVGSCVEVMEKNIDGESWRLGPGHLSAESLGGSALRVPEVRWNGA